MRRSMHPVNSSVFAILVLKDPIGYRPELPLMCWASVSRLLSLASSSIVSMPRSLSAFCHDLATKLVRKHRVTYAQTALVLLEQRLALIRDGIATQKFCRKSARTAPRQQQALTLAIPFEKASIVFAG